MAALSLYKRTLHFVEGKDQTSVAEVVGALGKYVPAAQAANKGRWWVRRAFQRHHRLSDTAPAAKLVEMGKHCLIRSILQVLERRGKIRRIQPGVYAPLEPKLFLPQSEVG